MSSDLQWMIIRRTSSFLRKGNKTTFSTEPNNLLNRNSARYNGLINAKAIGIERAEDDKGIVLVTKKKNTTYKPAQSFNKVTLKKNSRKTLTSLRNTIRANRYRKDLKKAALRRASAILKSQKPRAIKDVKGKSS